MIRRPAALRLSLALLMLAILAGLAVTTVQRLQANRARLAALESVLLTNPPPVDRAIRDQIIAAPKRIIAEQRLMEWIDRSATGSGLTIIVDGATRDNRIRTSKMGDSVITRSISAIGDEAAVLAFVSRLEQGRPLIRFRQWQMRPATHGSPSTIQWDGELRAAWHPAP